MGGGGFLVNPHEKTVSMSFWQVTLEMSTCFEAPIEGKVQIIIGTVPYRNLFEELMPTSCQALPLIVGIPSGTDSAPAPSHPVTVTPLDFNSRKMDQIKKKVQCTGYLLNKFRSFSPAFLRWSNGVLQSIWVHLTLTLSPVSRKSGREWLLVWRRWGWERTSFQSKICNLRMGSE